MGLGGCEGRRGVRVTAVGFGVKGTSVPNPHAPGLGHRGHPKPLTLNPKTLNRKP